MPAWEMPVMLLGNKQRRGARGSPFSMKAFTFKGLTQSLAVSVVLEFLLYRKWPLTCAEGLQVEEGRDLQRFPPTSTLKPTFWSLWGLRSQVLSGVRWGDCFVSAASAPSPCSVGFSVSVFYSGKSATTGPLSAFQLSKCWWFFFLFSLFYIQQCSWTFGRS